MMANQVAVEEALDQAVAVARGHLYSFLASAFADPAGDPFHLALDPQRQRVAVAAVELLRSETPERMELGPGERSPVLLDLSRVVKELTTPGQNLVKAHQKAFGLLIGKTAPLNETEYCASTDSFYRAQQLADIVGFYRAFGLKREAKERADHLSLELDFMARLIEKEISAAQSADPHLRERANLCKDAQRKFFEAHLAWWAPGFAELLRRDSAGGLYAVLADALAALIPLERSRFNLPPVTPVGCLPPLAETPRESAGCCSQTF